MSNSEKMTLEEKIVQHIKTMGLSTLIDDEDAITNLAKRAVSEALFQPVRINAGYGRMEERDSIAVSAARDIAKQATDTIAKTLIDQIANDPAIREAMLKTIIQCIPAAITNVLQDGIRAVINTHSLDSINVLQNQIWDLKNPNA